MHYRQITVIGCGLIGGSFAASIRAHRVVGTVVGCDRPEVLEQAIKAGVIDRGEPDPVRACAESEFVLLATPVGAIIDLIERLGPVLPESTLISDVGSSKLEIMERARSVFGAAVQHRFVGGHPMAGKEQGGISYMDPKLFANAVWLVTPSEGQNLESGSVAHYLKLVRRTGARIVPVDAARHDRLVAWISHLPQMVSTAIANTVQDFEDEIRRELGDVPELQAIGGRALREMTRTAASPYVMWRDVALTNSGNIGEALHRLEQRLAYIRENLRSPALREEFARANKFAREQRQG